MLMSSMVLRASWLTPTGILQPPQPMEALTDIKEKKTKQKIKHNSVEAQLPPDALHPPAWAFDHVFSF